MDIDLNELTPEEIVELGVMLADDLEKTASEEGDIDLNELTVEELVVFAAEVQEHLELEKVAIAGHRFNNVDAIAHRLKGGASSGASRAKDLLTGGSLRQAVEARAQHSKNIDGKPVGKIRTLASMLREGGNGSRTEAAKVVGSQAAVAGGAAGAGVGAYKLTRKKK